VNWTQVYRLRGGCSNHVPVDVRYVFKRPTDIFFLADTDIFKIFSTDIWPAADIWLATNTDILKFAYRYFNKVLFWLKLMQIAYGLDLRQRNNLTEQKVQIKAWTLLAKIMARHEKNFEQISINLEVFA